MYSKRVATYISYRNYFSEPFMNQTEQRQVKQVWFVFEKLYIYIFLCNFDSELQAQNFCILTYFSMCVILSVGN